MWGNFIFENLSPRTSTVIDRWHFGGISSLTSSIVPADIVKAVKKKVKKEFEKEVAIAKMMLQLLPCAGSIAITKK